MKDVTSTSFGLVIAFLLPGLAALYSLTFWSPYVAGVFNTFKTAESSIGFFLLVVLASLVFGLLVDVARRLFYDYFLCRGYRLGPERFAELGTEGKLTAFRAAVDEHYRYHQFWGGMTVVIPIGFAGWFRNSWERSSWTIILLLTVTLIVIEMMVGYTATIQYRTLMRRANHILATEGILISKGE